MIGGHYDGGLSGERRIILDKFEYLPEVAVNGGYALQVQAAHPAACVAERIGVAVVDETVLKGFRRHFVEPLVRKALGVVSEQDAIDFRLPVVNANRVLLSVKDVPTARVKSKLVLADQARKNGQTFAMKIFGSSVKDYKNLIFQKNHYIRLNQCLVSRAKF